MKRTAEEIMQAAHARVAQIVASAEQKAAEQPKQMFLPGFDEDMAAMPNHINRSSLFAPVARGRRKMHYETVMVTRADCVLEYTGQQLDEADADLMMALIWFAQNHPLGARVPLNRYEVLTKIGRSSGQSDYDWLHRRLKALRSATMFLEARKPDGSTRYKVGGMVSFNLVKELAGFEDDGSYEYTLDPRWVQLFGNREYSLCDFNKRLLIGRGQDMAKTLQRLIATSSSQVQRYSLDWMQAKMEYSGRRRDFKDALMRAVQELQRLKILDGGRIEDSTRRESQIVLWITPKDDRDSVAHHSG